MTLLTQLLNLPVVMAPSVSGIVKLFGYMSVKSPAYKCTARISCLLLLMQTMPCARFGLGPPERGQEHARQDRDDRDDDEQFDEGESTTAGGPARDTVGVHKMVGWVTVDFAVHPGRMQAEPIGQRRPDNVRLRAHAPEPESLFENPGARLCRPRPAAAGSSSPARWTATPRCGWSSTQPRSFFKQALSRKANADNYRPKLKAQSSKPSRGGRARIGGR